MTPSHSQPLEAGRLRRSALGHRGEGAVDFHSGTRQHVHRRVEAEELDAPPHQITDAQLGYAYVSCRSLDEVVNREHECRANLEVCGLVLAKPRSRNTLPLEGVIWLRKSVLPAVKKAVTGVEPRRR